MVKFSHTVLLLTHLQSDILCANLQQLQNMDSYNLTHCPIPSDCILKVRFRLTQVINTPDSLVPSRTPPFLKSLQLVSI